MTSTYTKLRLVKRTVRIADFSEQWEGRTVDGAYPLRRFLGGGENSAVFLSTNDTKIPAVIKLIPEPPIGEAQLVHWRAVSRLSHPNLIQIFATGRAEIDGMKLLYIVMENAEENLGQVLPERPLTPAETRDMLEPALSALEYIHRSGFAHTRLKPSNIMAIDDRLKLSSDSLSRPGTAGGISTTVYDPPERGDRQRVASGRCVVLRNHPGRGLDPALSDAIARDGIAPRRAGTVCRNCPA